MGATRGRVVVEDDYDGDLRLEGQPLEALRALDDRDEVIYLGTFAKALYPAVRLAFAVLPRWLVEYVARARAASDRHPACRDAMAVARFIESGELERHLVRLRRINRSRRDALVAALTEALGGRANRTGRRRQSPSAAPARGRLGPWGRAGRA